MNELPEGYSTKNTWEPHHMIKISCDLPRCDERSSRVSGSVSGILAPMPRLYEAAVIRRIPLAAHLTEISHFQRRFEDQCVLALKITELQLCI